MDAEATVLFLAVDGGYRYRYSVRMADLALYLEHRGTGRPVGPAADRLDAVAGDPLRMAVLTELVGHGVYGIESFRQAPPETPWPHPLARTMVNAGWRAGLAGVRWLWVRGTQTALRADMPRAVALWLALELDQELATDPGRPPAPPAIDTQQDIPTS